MTAQNVQNPIYMQPGQPIAPVQQVQGYVPVQYVQPQAPVSQPLQNGYIPRYAPMIQGGRVYGVPMAPTCPCYEQPKPGGVSSVNITINGVNPPTTGQTCPQYAVPQYIAPPPMPYYPPPNNIVSESKKIPEEPKEQAPPPPPAEEKAPEEKKNKKPVIELTNEYIRQLENDLNDKDKTIRAHAVAELVKRFKEDETRKDEPRLTNLLNLALQDTSKPIVYTAMQALESGYANGNNVTRQRLEAIRDVHDNFGNSDTADGLLTKMAGMPNNAALQPNDIT